MFLREVHYYNAPLIIKLHMLQRFFLSKLEEFASHVKIPRYAPNINLLKVSSDSDETITVR